MTAKILIIKHGALGDFVQALGVFKALAEFHGRENLYLLTTPPYVNLAKLSGYFTEVIVDRRPPIYYLPQWYSLLQQLNQLEFSRVYDLQWSDRGRLYFYFLKLLRSSALPPLEWSGLVAGCSHPHPYRDQWLQRHTLQRQEEQLKACGIPMPLPAPSFIDFPEYESGLNWDRQRPLALLIPGASPKRPEKCWTASNYAQIATKFLAQGYEVGLIGHKPEISIGEYIQRNVPQVHNWIGKTNFQDLIWLGQKAAIAVGNDTGPMHIMAVAGCSVTVLFFGGSDPTLCGPKNNNDKNKVQIIKSQSSADLKADCAWNRIRKQIKP